MCRTENLRKFNLFNIVSRRCKCPSARYASAAKHIGRDMDVFMGKSVLLNDFEINCNKRTLLKFCCVAVFLLYFIVFLFIFVIICYTYFLLCQHIDNK
jgi:hypothetical protein